QRGARVCLIDQAPAPADSSLLLPAQAITMGGVDLADAQQAQRALKSAAHQLDGIDGLVNVAGGFQWQPLEDQTGDAWERMHAMNLSTAVNACRAVIPYLRARG